MEQWLVQYLVVVDHHHHYLVIRGIRAGDCNNNLSHFWKSVTQCCPPSCTIVRISFRWLTQSSKILACLLLADTVVSCQSVSQLSHQPRPVHWTCSVTNVFYDRQAQIFSHISYQKLKVCCHRITSKYLHSDVWVVTMQWSRDTCHISWPLREL